ncbi:MAG: phage terminase large subunit, partial [Bacteroides sp.]
MKINQRFEMARLVQEQYPNFVDFCYDGLKFLGFEATRMQLHIAKDLNLSPDRFMIMAARGEGKTMITALYAVWSLIQDPTKIILVVSGFGEKAEEIAKLIYQIIMQWDILVYLRPDTSKKDLNSASKFDVHWALKGINQSPSVTCLGITASLVGRRADILISDDVETITNGMTPAQRDKLDRLTQEYTAIVTHGKIIYLGTPQTKDSIYNRLPGKGYKISIFPARYPTQSDMEKYGDKLASYIIEDIERLGESLQTGGGISGKLGQPVDPMRYDESDLIEKETELGSEGFALQYMLDTELSDALRQQLKPSDLIVANFSQERVPEKIDWACVQQNQVRFQPGFGSPDANMYYGIIPQCDWQDKPKDRVYCYIDPAGGGQDELAWSIGFSQAPYIHWVYTGGVRGGLTDTNTNHLIDTFIEYGVTRILVETNMGHGLFEINLRKAIADKIKEFEQQSKLLNTEDPLQAKILADKARILKQIGI